jgi:hypothetical protein
VPQPVFNRGRASGIDIPNSLARRNRKNEDWNEYDQMDAHELLRYLLDGVSMEEIDVSNSRQLRSWRFAITLTDLASSYSL